MDKERRKSFWHNFRLTRARLIGLPKQDRMDTYVVLRGGLILGATYAVSKALATASSQP